MFYFDLIFKFIFTKMDLINFMKKKKNYLVKIKINFCFIEVLDNN